MRIRTIKPEWLDDERLVLASPEARVLSIALIILADDYGNGRANRTILAARVFPGSRDPRETLASAIETLAGAGFIDLYEVDGQSYYSIRNWAKHQKVDHPSKPQVPGKPAVSESSRDSRETIASPRESLALDQDQDQEWTSKGEERTHAPEPSQAKPGQRTHPLGSGPIVGGIDPEEVRLAYVERWEQHAAGKRPPMVARGFGSPVWSELAQAFVDRETTTQILDAAFVDPFVRSTGWTPKAILGAMPRLSTADVRRNDAENPANGPGEGEGSGEDTKSILGALRARHDEELLLAEKCALRGDADGKLRHTAEAARLRVEWRQARDSMRKVAS